jgi:hypothetical protein
MRLRCFGDAAGPIGARTAMPGRGRTAVKSATAERGAGGLSPGRPSDDASVQDDMSEDDMSEDDTFVISDRI